MKIEDIVLEYPGIYLFLDAKKPHLRAEAYQQIPEKEMPMLWQLVIQLGTLEDLKFIYQKKLAAISFQEAFENYRYGCDVQRWDEAIRIILSLGDIEKLKFIISKGACKFIASKSSLQTICADNIKYAVQSNNPQVIELYLNELLKLRWIFDSEEAKNILHKSILELFNTELEIDFHKKFTQPMIISHFLNSARFKDYLIHAAEQNSIKQFATIYQLIPLIFKEPQPSGLKINNIITQIILTNSESSEFCKNALEIITSDENIRLNGKIHPVLRSFMKLEIGRNKDLFKPFLMKFKSEFKPEKQFISPTLLLDLLTDQNLRKCLYDVELSELERVSIHIPQSEGIIRNLCNEDGIDDVLGLWGILAHLAGKHTINRMMIDMLFSIRENTNVLRQKFISGFHKIPEEDAKEFINDLKRRTNANNSDSFIYDFLYDLLKANNKNVFLFQEVFILCFRFKPFNEFKALLETDDYIFSYYQAFENVEFKAFLFMVALSSPVTYFEKILYLDLPYEGFVANLSASQQNEYYTRKSQEIIAYIEIDQTLPKGSDIKNALLSELGTLRRTPADARSEEQKNRMRFLHEILTKPLYLAYVEKGASMSLARCFSTGVRNNNASKQMVLDTFNYCLKKHPRNESFMSYSTWFVSRTHYIGDYSHRAFIEKLLSCSRIKELMPLSFQKRDGQTVNPILSTLENQESLKYCTHQLLDIKEFLDAGLNSNFGISPPPPSNNQLNQGSYRDIAESRESSMRGLDPDEILLVERLRAHYGPEYNQISGTVDDKRTRLKAILIDLYNENPLIINGIRIPSNVSLEYFNTLSSEKRKECLLHPLHSVIRYLSVPNHLLHHNADHVDRYRQRNCAILEESQIEYLWLYWLAASDNSESMKPPQGITLKQRIEIFITNLACLARAHNWDRTRMNLLTLRNEQYDDLDLDRPTCSSGASKRIISSLFYHPLLESEFISAKTMLEQFIGDVMFEHIKSQITLEDYQFIFDAVRNPEELSHEDLSKLKRLNLEMSKKMDFVNKINNKFPNSAVPWIYKQLINHAFTTNNNCHVLTCSAKIQNLANDIIALIKNIINKQVLIVIEGDVSVNVNNSSIKRRWCEIYEENSEYPEALKDMEFSQKMSEMEKIIGECDIEDDLKAKFDEKLPDNGLEDAFYSELQNYILGITTHENPKAFLETWFKKTYDVFNWDTFSNLQQDWILRDLLDKVRRFTDAVPSNRYLFSELNPLIKRIHSRLEILSKKTSEASNNNTFSTIGLSR